MIRIIDDGSPTGDSIVEKKQKRPYIHHQKKSLKINEDETDEVESIFKEEKKYKADTSKYRDLPVYNKKKINTTLIYHNMNWNTLCSFTDLIPINNITINDDNQNLTYDIDPSQIVIGHNPKNSNNINLFTTTSSHIIPIIKNKKEKTKIKIMYKTTGGLLLEKAIIVNSILDKSHIGLWCFIPLNSGTRKKVVEYKKINGVMRVISYDDYQIEENINPADDLLSYSNFRDETDEFTSDDNIKCYNLINKLKKISKNWSTIRDALEYLEVGLYQTNDPIMIMKLLQINEIISNIGK